MKIFLIVTTWGVGSSATGIQWVEARDGTKHPTMNKPIPPPPNTHIQNKDLAPNGNSATIEKPRFTYKIAPIKIILIHQNLSIRLGRFHYFKFDCHFVHVHTCTTYGNTLPGEIIRRLLPFSRRQDKKKTDQPQSVCSVVRAFGPRTEGLRV